MTAPTYDTLTVDDTGADKILTTGTMQAVDQNPVSIAQRGTNAPLVQPPVREYKTSGTSATWTIPTGVTAFTIVGQGGGGGGGASTVVYNGVTYTANAGGTYSGSDGSAAGGTATNGDINITGGNGYGRGDGSGTVYASIGGSSILGNGGNFGSGTGYGAGSGGASYFGGATNVGGGGGYFKKRIEVVPGQTSATYTVGAAGTYGTAGVVVFEY